MRYTKPELEEKLIEFDEQVKKDRLNYHIYNLEFLADAKKKLEKLEQECLGVSNSLKFIEERIRDAFWKGPHSTIDPDPLLVIGNFHPSHKAAMLFAHWRAGLDIENGLASFLQIRSPFMEGELNHNFYLLYTKGVDEAGYVIYLNDCEIDYDKLEGVVDIYVQGFDRMQDIDDALDEMAGRCPELEKAILNTRVKQSHPYVEVREEGKRIKI